MARIIPIEEAARRLGVTVEELAELVRAGRLRVRALWGRRFVDPRDLDPAGPPHLEADHRPRVLSASSAAGEPLSTSMREKM